MRLLGAFAAGCFLAVAASADEDATRAFGFQSKAIESLKKCQFDKAMALQRRGLALAKDNASMHGTTSVVYRIAGDFTNALSAAEHSVSLDPSCAPCHAQLGMTLYRIAAKDRDIEKYRSGAYDGATKACERALELDPNEADGNVCLGLIALDNKQASLAVEYLSKALAAGSSFELGGNCAVLFHLAQAYDLKGDDTNARYTYEDFLGCGGRISCTGEEVRLARTRVAQLKK